MTKGNFKLPLCFHLIQHIILHLHCCIILNQTWYGSCAPSSDVHEQNIIQVDSFRSYHFKFFVSSPSLLPVCCLWFWPAVGHPRRWKERPHYIRSLPDKFWITEHILKLLTIISTSYPQYSNHEPYKFCHGGLCTSMLLHGFEPNFVWKLYLVSRFEIGLITTLVHFRLSSPLLLMMLQFEPNLVHCLNLNQK